MGTHRNVCTNLMSLFSLNTRGSRRFGARTVEVTGTRTNSAFLLSVPLFHVTGCHSVIHEPGRGGKIIMMHSSTPSGPSS